MKVAEERRFRDYRTDLQRSTCARCEVALRRLRQLTRTGDATELDLDETIDETCRNAGEIELVFRPPRRNDVRLLLLMDVGGTMDPYYEPVSQLLTALHEERGLRDFQPYYFHNCIYDHVYTQRAHVARRRGADRRRAAPARRRAGRSLVVGDAAMHPAELLEPYGGIDPRVTSPTPGVEWLQRIAESLRPHRVDQPRTAPGQWDDSQTDTRHPPPVPDVPADRRRRHRRRAGAGRRAGGACLTSIRSSSSNLSGDEFVRGEHAARPADRCAAWRRVSPRGPVGMDDSRRDVGGDRYGAVTAEEGSRAVHPNRARASSRSQGGCGGGGRRTRAHVAGHLRRSTAGDRRLQRQSPAQQRQHANRRPDRTRRASRDSVADVQLLLDGRQPLADAVRFRPEPRRDPRRAGDASARWRRTRRRRARPSCSTSSRRTSTCSTAKRLLGVADENVRQIRSSSSSPRAPGCRRRAALRRHPGARCSSPTPSSIR